MNDQEWKMELMKLGLRSITQTRSKEEKDIDLNSNAHLNEHSCGSPFHRQIVSHSARSAPRIQLCVSNGFIVFPGQPMSQGINTTTYSEEKVTVDQSSHRAIRAYDGSENKS